MIIEINKDIEKYQESVAMRLTAKQLVYSILALGSGCLIVFLLYEKIGLTFSCYVVVPIVAPLHYAAFIPITAWDLRTCSPGICGAFLGIKHWFSNPAAIGRCGKK